MQTRSGPPSDLMWLLVWPLVAIAVMALGSDVAMTIFNWLQR